MTPDTPTKPKSLMPDDAEMYLHVRWRGEIDCEVIPLHPDQELDVEALAQQWADAMGVTFDTSGGHVPRGCGDIEFTITNSPDPDIAHCWDSADYFLSTEEF